MNQRVVAAGFVLFRCGPRSIGDGAEGSTSTTGDDTGPAPTGDVEPGATNTSAPADDGTEDAQATAESESGITDPMHPPVDCEDPFVDCGTGECVALAVHDAHCGECFHRCEGVGSEHCWTFECQPALQPCITDRTISTCSDACASVGQICAIDADCSGRVAVYLNDGPSDAYVEEDIDSCVALYGPEAYWEQGCDEPLDWDFDVGGRTPVGVACCCTQD